MNKDQIRTLKKILTVMGFWGLGIGIVIGLFWVGVKYPDIAKMLWVFFIIGSIGAIVGMILHAIYEWIRFEIW